MDILNKYLPKFNYFNEIAITSYSIKVLRAHYCGGYFKMLCKFTSGTKNKSVKIFKNIYLHVKSSVKL